MKKIKIISVLALLFVLNVASMCSDDDDTPTNVNQTQVINAVISGTWRITNYVDSGVNETANFTGYNFTFASNNVLTAVGNGLTTSGTWSVTDSNSNDDTLNDLDFNIAFTTPANFVDLTDDWDIVSRTDTKIQLIDVSGGNGGTDYLTFEKN
ncbi:hypothetical protein [Flavobacterium sp.]|uniref:hypothetical protein n=1 Tax=Flavobacterium sp. TaxID=239 RepID=UPI0025BF5891|nr:hypothetical protein [Flavobacterium sp.]